MAESKLRPVHYPRDGTLTAGTDCIRNQSRWKDWTDTCNSLSKEVGVGRPIQPSDTTACCHLWSSCWRTIQLTHRCFQLVYGLVLGILSYPGLHVLTCLKRSGLGSWKMLGSSIITRIAFGGWWLHLRSAGLMTFGWLWESWAPGRSLVNSCLCMLTQDWIPVLKLNSLVFFLKNMS